MHPFSDIFSDIFSISEKKQIKFESKVSSNTIIFISVNFIATREWE
jgi:hypothetical protein